MTPVILREIAEQDLEAITDYYLDVAGVEVTASFLEDLERALAHLKQQPESGSTRFAVLAGQSGLRVWPLRNFPYLVFYLHEAGRLDVLRVLHSARDIPAHLRE